MPDRPDLDTAIRLYRQGAFDAAAQACRELLAREADNVRALNLLGVLMTQAGRLADAEASYRRAVEADPKGTNGLVNLGTTLIMRGAADEAVPYLRKAVRLDPSDAEAQNGLGFALFATDDPAGALDHLREAVRLDPRHAEAHVNLGKVLLEHDRFAEAESCFRTALRAMPDFERAAMSLGDVLVRQHRLTDALAVFEKIRSRNPASVPAAMASLKTLMWLGRDGEAAAIVQVYLASEAPLPDDVARAYGALAGAGGLPADAIGVLEERFARMGDDPAHAQTLHFVLGDLHDRTNAFDEAFRHMAAANAIRVGKRASVAADPSIDRIAAYFSQERLAALPRAADETALPVFIVGFPRSGKSLVEHLLAAHPDVAPGSELMGILRMAAAFGVRFEDTSEAQPTLAQADLDAAQQDYLGILEGIAGGARRLTNTLPYNFKHLGLIALLFPGARVVHCVRDPIDTCLACYFKQFPAGYAFDDLHGIGTYYRQYDRLMRHWRAVLDLPILEVRYEDLVAEPTATRRQLVEFLGLEPVAGDRYAAVATRDWISLPIDSAHVGRARHYEAHLAPLREALGEGR